MRLGGNMGAWCCCRFSNFGHCCRLWFYWARRHFFGARRHFFAMMVVMVPMTVMTMAVVVMSMLQRSCFLLFVINVHDTAISPPLNMNFVTDHRCSRWFRLSCFLLSSGLSHGQSKSLWQVQKQDAQESKKKSIHLHCDKVNLGEHLLSKVVCAAFL